jgi:hypothetical protein
MTQESGASGVFAQKRRRYRRAAMKYAEAENATMPSVRRTE